MTHLHVCCDSFGCAVSDFCVLCLIILCVLWLAHVGAVTGLHVCRDSFICVPWLTYMRAWLIHLSVCDWLITILFREASPDFPCDCLNVSRHWGKHFLVKRCWPIHTHPNQSPSTYSYTSRFRQVILTWLTGLEYLLQHDSTLKRKTHSKVFFEKWNDTEKPKKKSEKRELAKNKWYNQMAQVGTSWSMWNKWNKDKGSIHLNLSTCAKVGRQGRELFLIQGVVVRRQRWTYQAQRQDWKFSTFHKKTIRRIGACSQNSKRRRLRRRRQRLLVNIDPLTNKSI